MGFDFYASIKIPFTLPLHDNCSLSFVFWLWGILSLPLASDIYFKRCLLNFMQLSFISSVPHKQGQNFQRRWYKYFEHVSTCGISFKCAELNWFWLLLLSENILRIIKLCRLKILGQNYGSHSFLPSLYWINLDAMLSASTGTSNVTSNKQVASRFPEEQPCNQANFHDVEVVPGTLPRRLLQEFGNGGRPAESSARAQCHRIRPAHRLWVLFCAYCLRASLFFYFLCCIVYTVTVVAVISPFHSLHTAHPPLPQSSPTPLSTPTGPSCVFTVILSPCLSEALVLVKEASPTSQGWSIFAIKFWESDIGHPPPVVFWVALRTNFQLSLVLRKCSAHKITHSTVGFWSNYERDQETTLVNYQGVLHQEDLNICSIISY